MPVTTAYYGLDAWLAPPPLSALLGILLLLGSDWLGCIVLKKSKLINDDRWSALRMQSVLIGTMVLAMILYPLALMQVLPLILIQSLAWMLVLLGVFQGYRLLKEYFILPITVREYLSLITALRFDFIISLGIIFSLFLVALGPVTNADALDYHIGMAIEILNHGGIVFLPEWFTSSLAGNGELINALGLSIGSEQFGSLLQWASLISIASLVWPDFKDAKARSESAVLLAVLSSPVILFLVSGPKPQLWPVAMTCLAFYLFVKPGIEKATNEQLKIKFALACILCMCAWQAKFNYILGGGIAGGLAFLVMILRREALSAIFIFVISASLIILPMTIWKVVVLNASVIDVFLTPLPAGLPGNELAMQIFSKNADFSSRFIFPFSIMFPSSLGEVSAILGVGWILIFSYRTGSRVLNRIAFTMLTLFLITTIFLAPPAARSYLEPYFWGLILCSIAIKEGRLIFPSYSMIIVSFQAVIFLMLSVFGVGVLTAGSISGSLREQIMSKSANGYDLMRWVDEILPEDAILLNNHRTMALAPRKTFNNFFWGKYVGESSDSANIYLNRIKEMGTTHILVVEKASLDSPMSGCYGQNLAGPQEFTVAARNPFNAGTKFSAWLIEFNYHLLPGCAKETSN